MMTEEEFNAFLLEDLARKRENEPTLRDQFAMAALTGYCAYNGYVGQDPGLRAHYAYEMADAMLAAREQKK